MGLFKPKNPPDTISDERWDKIRKGAGRAEAREGGMFGQKAVERRKLFSQNLAKKTQN